MHNFVLVYAIIFVELVVDERIRNFIDDLNLGLLEFLVLLETGHVLWLSFVVSLSL